MKTLKIRQIKGRLHTTNRARRGIINELSACTHDQIAFVARRADDGRWVTCSEIQHDVLFYASELMLASTRAEVLVEHLNRIGDENGS